jgi:hypothetical protein
VAGLLGKCGGVEGVGRPHDDGVAEYRVRVQVPEKRAGWRKAAGSRLQDMLRPKHAALKDLEGKRGEDALRTRLGAPERPRSYRE